MEPVRGPSGGGRAVLQSKAMSRYEIAVDPPPDGPNPVEPDPSHPFDPPGRDLPIELGARLVGGPGHVRGPGPCR